MEEESGISVIEGAESFDWPQTQTDNASSSDLAENGTELLSTDASVSEYTTSAFVIEPIAIDSSATDDISKAGISNGHPATDDGLSNVLFSESESGLGILLGSVTSLSEQSVEAASMSSTVSQQPLATSSLSSGLQQCVVCKRMMKCKFNIVRDGDTKHLCTEICFKVFKCNPTMYLDTRMIPLSTSSSTNTYLVSQIPSSESNGKAIVVSSVNGKPTSLKCFKCQNYIMQANLNKYGVAYMGGRACFCESACLIQFVRDNRLCASCGVSVQGKETALFVNTPLDKYLYFCTPSCKDKFCITPSSSTAVSTVPVATLSTTSGSSTTIVTPPQVIEILGDDDDVEIVGVTSVSDSKRTSRTDQPLNAANSAPMSALLSSTAKKKGCSVCGDHQVMPKYTFSCLGKIHYVCGEACLQAFKYANKVNLAPCPQCARVFVASGGGTLVTAKFEGETKLFCSNPCLERYRRQRQKNASCAWCGTKRTNADLVERVDANGKVQLFCTLKCLSLYRVNLQAMSNVSVPCDQCRRLRPAQYHLTMSDASVRNFCSYDCVMNYQTQFNSDSSSQPKPAAAAATGRGANSLIPVPVISEVVSMAPGRKKGTQKVLPVSMNNAAGSASRANNSSLLPALSTNNLSVKIAQNEDLAQANMRQLFIMPPQPRPMVNKSTTCKPVSLTKATTCRPQTTPHTVQTEADMFEKPVLIPVPVPIFVPVPVPMYTMPTPYPLPIPVPLPVPIFLPTTAKTAANVSKHIQEVLESTPVNPYEADILHLAEAVAMAESETPANVEEDLPDIQTTETVLDTMLAMDHEPSSVATMDGGMNHEMSDDALIAAARIASEVPNELAIDFEECVDSLPANQAMSRLGKRQPPTNRGGGNGVKRARVDSGSIVGGDGNDVDLDDGLIQVSIGVNAWRVWVLQKNIRIQQQLACKSTADSSRALSSKKVALGGIGTIKPFNTDPLLCAPEELAIALSMFVREARKPTGEEYAPDTMFYFCLGVQQYLYKRGRADNIFTDTIYEQFSDILNDIMQRYEIRLNLAGEIVARIDEEHLWETKQLGAHSPHTLLATLIYFNTKYFLLKRAEDHQALSFQDIVKHWKKPPGNTARGSKIYYLRYVPSAILHDPKRGKIDETMVLEQAENLVDGMRCPVKLYEFYLSKCPEAAKCRDDMFYLVPERSCIADSPVWYSSQPVSVEMLVKILSRLRVVRELQEIYLHDATM